MRRLNKSCKFFPCHKGLEDCTFCYCPFYPCLNKKRGNYIYSPKLKKKIWSCQHCDWIHGKETVDGIFSLISKSNFIKASCFAQHSPSSDISKTGIIIFSHGSKLKDANKSLYKIIRIVKRRLRFNRVEPAYLAFSLPNLSQSVKILIGKGCQRLIIIPFFLFNGSHVKEDIPKAIKRERQRYPKVKFICTKSLAAQAQLCEIIIERIRRL